MTPTVSVIIVNYNTVSDTLQCIRSVKQFTDSATTQIVVVDNASTEADPEIFKREFPDIALVRNPVNRGFAGGNNDGIAHATGDYLLLLNSDTEFTSDALTPVVQLLESNPQFAAATGRLIYPDGKVQHNCQRFPSVRISLAELIRFQKWPFFRGRELLGGPFFTYDRLYFPDWIWGTYFLISRRWLNRFDQGKLPEDYFLYVEDMLWCRKLRDLGGQVVFTPEVTIIHKVGRSGGKRPELMVQNTDDFMRKYYSTPHRWLIRKFRYLLTGKPGYL